MKDKVSLDSGEILSDSEINEIEEAYEIYKAECNAAMRLTLARIQNLSEAIDRAGTKNPFDRIESRIKTFESVKGKCRKRRYGFSDEEIRENVRDVAGIRIITKFVDEINKVREMIERMPGINVCKTKDYVKEPKENGYQSVHLDCQVEVHDPIRGSRLCPVEIQIRTKAMNLWSEMEHDLRYKNPEPSPEAEEEFQKAAKMLRELEKKFMELRDYGVVESNIASISSNIAIADLSSREGETPE